MLLIMDTLTLAHVRTTGSILVVAIGFDSS